MSNDEVTDKRRWREWSRRRDTVVITGIGGRLGQALARRLHRSWEVIGVDRRPLDTLPPDIDFHKVDIRRRKTEDIFRQNRVDALIHLNIMHDPRKSPRETHDFNVRGTQKLLDLCQQHNVGKVIILSSANVYGPAPTNNQFLTEEAPLMGGQTFSEIRDLISLDMYASSFFWRHPEIETVILRPVHIVGDVGNAPSNYLRMKRIPTLVGYDPMIQLIHIDDVVQAITRALRPGIRGIFNVAGPGQLPLSELIKALGKRSVPMIEPLAKPILNMMWRARLTSFPTPELDHIKFVCMVDDSRARRFLKYSPERTMEETIRALA